MSVLREVLNSKTINLGFNLLHLKVLYRGDSLTEKRLHFLLVYLYPKYLRRFRWELLTLFKKRIRRYGKTQTHSVSSPHQHAPRESIMYMPLLQYFDMMDIVCVPITQPPSSKHPIKQYGVHLTYKLSISWIIK